ncbi:hypothetical protein [Enterococcus sp. LJL90]
MDMFSDEFLAFLELEQDMLFQKIPKDRIMPYIKKSLETGNSYAQQQSKDIVELYKENKITLKEEQHDGVFFKVQMRAQFETDKKGNNVVYLYKASIQELAQSNNLTYNQMKKIILTHEFFHFIESKNGEVFEELPSVETARLLGISRKAKIRRTSEIAANAFTKSFLKLRYLPNYFDYQHLLKKQEISDSDLEEDFQRFQNILSDTKDTLNKKEN